MNDLPDMDRRSLLRWLAYSTAGAGVAGAGLHLATRGSEPGGAGEDAATTPVTLDGPVLVIVELGGGNDGLSTLLPFESGQYHDLRPTLGLTGDDVVDLGDGWGLNAGLRGVHDRGVALVSGVGSLEPDLSHSTMTERWHRGLPGAITGAARTDFASGFLGRLCEAITTRDELIGVSLRYGDSPFVRARRPVASGLGNAFGTPLFRPEVAGPVRSVVEDLARGDRAASAGLLGQARASLAQVGGILEVVNDLPEPTGSYPEHDIGWQLSFTSRLIRAGIGMRVIHSPMGFSSFDTHQDHAATHGRLMRELGDALCAFHDDLAAHGVADQVLVATTSEFGRRPDEHAGGLDHGTASTMMLMGPITPGIHGEPSTLRRFDDEDNLIPTLEFDRYYATLAAWMGVDPAQVLEPRAGRVAAPLAGVLA